MRPTPPFPIILAITACLAACSQTAVKTPEPRPLGRELAAWRAPEPAEEEAPEREPVSPSGALSLGDALAAALLGNPDLGSASWEIRAAEARAIQASLFPNPELEVEVEDFGGQGDLSGLSFAEITVLLSQDLPLGGRIGKRTAAARFEGSVAGWDYEAARLDVLTGTAKAFVAVLAAQESLAVAEEKVGLTEEVVEVLAEQVRAGKSPPLQARKAEVSHALARLDRDRAKRELDDRRRRLAAFWGAGRAAFASVRGDFYRTSPVPSREALVAHLAENPDVARWDAALDHRRALVDTARAEAWPDLTLTAGAKRIQELDLYAFVLGVSIPLPLFDRNQGGVGEARAEAEKAREDRRRALVAAETGFEDAFEALAQAGEGAATLRDEVLPSARLAFDAAEEGYRGGKFGYLDVLDAQETLFDTKRELIEALLTYHTAVADLERLVGRRLGGIE